MIYGLIFLGHLTTSAQEQRQAIEQYAKKHHMDIDRFVSYEKMPGVNMFKSGDCIIFFAWNCISAQRSHLNKFIQYLLQNNIYMHSATSQYCIDNRADFQQMQHAFNLYEDIRFNFLSGKSVGGIKKRIANGKAPGRHKGSINLKHAWDGKEQKILDMYANGASMYAIAKKIKVSAPTIKRFLTTQLQQHQ